MPEKKDHGPVWAPCVECGGGQRRHEVLKQHVETGDPDIHLCRTTYEICKCMGCGTIRFRQGSLSEDDVDPDTGKMIESVRAYPEHRKERHTALDASSYPQPIRRMYLEAVRAWNAGAPGLAGGGLRATVEALCRDQGVTGRNLEKRIDALVAKELLAKPQAALLHQERFLGNDTLHQFLVPTDDELETGMQIIENLLTTIYVLPAKAKKMRSQRRVRPGKTP